MVVLEELDMRMSDILSRLRALTHPRSRGLESQWQSSGVSEPPRADMKAPGGRFGACSDRECGA